MTYLTYFKYIFLFGLIGIIINSPLLTPSIICSLAILIIQSLTRFVRSFYSFFLWILFLCFYFSGLGCLLNYLQDSGYQDEISFFWNIFLISFIERIYKKFHAVTSSSSYQKRKSSFLDILYIVFKSLFFYGIQILMITTLIYAGYTNNSNILRFLKLFLIIFGIIDLVFLVRIASKSSFFHAIILVSILFSIWAMLTFFVSLKPWLHVQFLSTLSAGFLGLLLEFLTKHLENGDFSEIDFSQDPQTVFNDLNGIIFKNYQHLNINYDELKMEQQIGRGSFAQVFECRYKSGLFAAKVFTLDDLTLEQRILDSVTREFQALTRIKHNNLVTLIGYCLHDKQLVIIMDLFKMDFLKVLKNKREEYHEKKHLWFTQPELITYFKDILSGLEYLHSIQIAHRDLKPENILARLNRFGKVESLHITDFGVSKIFNNEEKISKTVSGSIPYLAPEVARLRNLQTGNYEPYKADIFSFGVIVYQFISGDPLNRGLPDIIEGKLPEISQERIEQYPIIISIYTHSIQFNPSERFSATQLLNLLKNQNQ